MNIYAYICNAIKLEMSVNAAFANYVKIFIKIAYFPGCYSWGFFIYNNLKRQRLPDISISLPDIIIGLLNITLILPDITFSLPDITISLRDFA